LTSIMHTELSKSSMFRVYLHWFSFLLCLGNGSCDDVSSALQTIFKTNKSKTDAGLPNVRHTTPCVWLRIPFGCTDSSSGNNDYTHCMHEVDVDNRDKNSACLKYYDELMFAKVGGDIEILASSSFLYSTWSPEIYSASNQGTKFLGAFKHWIYWTNIVANYTMPAAYTALSHHKLMRKAWQDYRQFIPDLDIPLNWKNKDYRAWIWNKMSDLMDWQEKTLTGKCEVTGDLSTCTPDFNVWKRMNETRERARKTTVTTIVPLDNGQELKVNDPWYMTIVRDLEITASIGFATGIVNYKAAKGKGDSVSYQVFYEDYKAMFAKRDSCEDFGALYGSQSMKEYKTSGIPRWFDKEADLEKLYGTSKVAKALIEQLGYVRKSYFGLYDWSLMSLFKLAKTEGKVSKKATETSVEEVSVKGKEMWVIPKTFKNDAKKASAMAAQHAKDSLLDVRYRASYEARYGSEFYQKSIKPVRVTNGDYKGKDAEYSQAGKGTKGKKGNSPLQAEATEVLYKGGVQIINPELMDPLMCARLKLIDKDMVAAMFKEGNNMFFKEQLSGIPKDGGMIGLTSMKKWDDNHKWWIVWDKWLEGVYFSMKNEWISGWKGQDPIFTIMKADPYKDKLPGQETFRAKNDNNKNKFMDWHGIWIPCDVIQDFDIWKPFGKFECTPMTDPESQKQVHVQFVFPRQFYSPMDQRGEIDEVGSMKEILIATGRSIANEETNTKEAQAFDQKNGRGFSGNEKFNTGAQGVSKDNKLLPNSQAYQGRDGKLEEVGANVQGRKDAEGQMNVYLDKWCINQMKCKKAGLSIVTLYFEITQLPLIFVCGAIGRTWNRASVAAVSMYKDLQLSFKEPYVLPPVILQSFLILMFQEMVIEGDSFLTKACADVYAYKKGSSMWDPGEVVTMDAKLRMRSCDDLKSSLGVARRLRKALYSLLPLFSLKALLYSDVPEIADLREWLGKGRQWIIKKDRGQEQVLNKMRDQLVTEKFFSDQGYTMRFGQQEVENQKYIVGVTFIGYWEYLMDNLERISFKNGPTLEWDPCDKDPRFKDDTSGEPLPLFRIGMLPIDATLANPKPREKIYNKPEPPLTAKLPFEYKYYYPGKRHKKGPLGNVVRSGPKKETAATSVDDNKADPYWLICDPFKELDDPTQRPGAKPGTLTFDVEKFVKFKKDPNANNEDSSKAGFDGDASKDIST